MAITIIERNKEAKVSHHNLVLREYYDNNYRIMSDVWGAAHCAIVWNVEHNKPETLLLRVRDYDWDTDARVEIDATPDIKMAYHNYEYNRAYKYQFEKMQSFAESEARVINKGDIVKVVSGRKDKGLQGKVVVKIEARYGMGYRSSMEYKLGVATSDEKEQVFRNGKVYENYKDVSWVWARNTEKVSVPAVDLEPIREAATAAACRELVKLKAA
jgi:hypothetical protein